MVYQLRRLDPSPGRFLASQAAAWPLTIDRRRHPIPYPFTLFKVVEFVPDELGQVWRTGGWGNERIDRLRDPGR
jgi:hypothetical protein